MFPIGTEWSEYLISWHNLICFMYEINVRSDGREVSNMKMVVLSNILVWTLRKEVQTLELFGWQSVLSTICHGICIDFFGRYPMEETICHDGHSMTPFVSCAFVPAGLFLQNEGGWCEGFVRQEVTEQGGWLGEVGAMSQTAQNRLFGHWHRLSISFPLLFRPKLGRDSWHHVDPQNREMECELCLTCVLTVLEVSCKSYD